MCTLVTLRSWDSFRVRLTLGSAATGLRFLQGPPQVRIWAHSYNTDTLKPGFSIIKALNPRAPWGPPQRSPQAADSWSSQSSQGFARALHTR